MPDVNILTALLAAAFYLVGALFVLIRRSGPSLARRLAFLYFLVSVFWCVGVAVHYSELGAGMPNLPFIRLSDLGLMILSALFLLLTQAILAERTVNWGWVIFSAAWAVLSLAAGLGGWLLQETSTLPDTIQAALLQSGEILVIAGWGILVAAAAAVITKAFRQGGRSSQNAPYWLLALFLIAVGDISWFTGYTLSSLLFRALGGALAAMVVSWPRRKISGEQAGLFSKFLAIVVFTFGLALALVAGRTWPELNPFLIGLGGALILVFVLRTAPGKPNLPAQDDVMDAQDNMAGLLRQYSTSITNTLDLNLLATVAAGTASELLEIRRGFLFLVELSPTRENPEAYFLRGIKGMGDLDPPSLRLRQDSLLAALFQRKDLPLTQDQLVQQPSFPQIPISERDWLDQLGAAVYVPIHSQDAWIGLLALGPKGSGAEYTPQDLAFLCTMAHQTAVALENARLVEGLRRLNEEFRRAYLALEQANQHLERLDKTKTDFITIVSHELRTPLNLITSAGQMLLDEPELQDNPYYKQVLDNLNNGVLRLNLIVESLLDMARIDTRLMVLELQPVSIQQVIRMIYNDLKEDAEARQQTIEISDLERLPFVMADLPALRKVFYHLVVNAIKYTPDGGKITIWGRGVPPNGNDLPGGGIEVVVCDNGIGIDPSYRDLVFTKFYQTGESALHSSGWTKFRGGGPGLGLSIARGIVDAHQGKIWVESLGYDEKQCPGSQFHVLLPLRQVHKPEMRAAQTGV